MSEESAGIMRQAKKASLFSGAIFTLSAVITLGLISIIFESLFLIMFIWAIMPAVFLASSSMWWFIVEKKGRYSIKYGVLAGLAASLSTYLLTGIIWNLGLMIFSLITDGVGDSSELFANPVSMIGIAFMGFMMSFPLIPIPMVIGGFLAYRRGRQSHYVLTASIRARGGVDGLG